MACASCGTEAFIECAEYRECWSKTVRTNNVQLSMAKEAKETHTNDRFETAWCVDAVDSLLLAELMPETSTLRNGWRQRRVWMCESKRSKRRLVLLFLKTLEHSKGKFNQATFWAFENRWPFCYRIVLRTRRLREPPFSSKNSEILSQK